MELKPQIAKGGVNLDANKVGGEQISAQTENQPAPTPPASIKQNAAALLDRTLQNLQALDRKNNLQSSLPPNNSTDKTLAPNLSNGKILSDGKIPIADNPAKFVEQKSEKFDSKVQTAFERVEQHLSETAKQPARELSVQKPVEQFAQTAFERTQRNTPTQQTEQKTPTPIKTLDNLIERAQDHPAFEKFRDRPAGFWHDVREMSEVTIEKSVFRGETVTRATSRYAELLDRLQRTGNNLAAFLETLPPRERDVFLARYLMDKILDAGKLLHGAGVELNRQGEFELKTFLQNNNKYAAFSVNTALALAENELLNQEFALVNETQFAEPNLFNSKSAALLGLSLNLHENINALLTTENLLTQTTANFKLSGDGKAAAAQPNADPALKPNRTDKTNNEPNIIAALFNKALLDTANDRKIKNRQQPAAHRRQAIVNRGSHAAGATGAMIGAAIGCLVPLTADCVSPALNFAASVVIGGSERGLRAANINTAITDIINGGVQILLDAANPVDSLPLPIAADESSASVLLNRRRNTLLLA